MPMHVVFNGQVAADGLKKMFLAGPTPRGDKVPSWRKTQALPMLDAMNFCGTVIVPEPEEGPFLGGTSQYDWEERNLVAADLILFWIPRDMQTMPGLTTNVEWGRWESSGKVVLGYPEGGRGRSYILHYAKKFDVPSFVTLEETLACAVAWLNSGKRP